MRIMASKKTQTKIGTEEPDSMTFFGGVGQEKMLTVTVTFFNGEKAKWDSHDKDHFSRLVSKHMVNLNRSKMPPVNIDRRKKEK